MSNFIAFAAGMVCGAGLTYVIMRSTSKTPENAIQDHSEDAMTEEELIDHYVNGLKELGYGVMTEDEYASSSVNPIDDDEDEDEEEEDEGPLEPRPTPYFIEEGDFGSKDGYSNVSMSWYKGDSTMTDEDNEPMDNWEYLVGGIQDKLQACNDDTMYVRSEVSMCDYEILIFDDSYKHAVLGEEDEEDLGNMAD